MTHVRYADAAERAELLDVEERRRTALLDVDLDALADLYDDALVHIHAPGLSHTKEQLLEHVSTRQAYIDMERGDLVMRLIGEIAVVTGPLINRLRNPDGSERTVAGEVTQVLRRCDDGAWRFISFQMSPYGEQVWPDLPSEKSQNGSTAS